MDFGQVLKLRESIRISICHMLSRTKVCLRKCGTWCHPRRTILWRVIRPVHSTITGCGSTKWTNMARISLIFYKYFIRKSIKMQPIKSYSKPSSPTSSTSTNRNLKHSRKYHPSVESLTTKKSPMIDLKILYWPKMILPNWWRFQLQVSQQSVKRKTC